MVDNPYFISLPDRGFIHIEGPDRFSFLQGLITNDIEVLKTEPVLYACLLSPQGKFLHDFFVSQAEDVCFLDCEGGARAHDLYERLNRYRMRAEVQISIEEQHLVYAVYGQTPQPGYPDPRHPDMGWRSFVKPEGIHEESFDVWDRRRIAFRIPDGSRDMVPEKSTLLEYRIDELGGISYKKGCYVGQEITARMHYRGLVKKRLSVIQKETSLPDPGTAIEDDDGKKIGEMRSSCSNIGLALLKTG